MDSHQDKEERKYKCIICPKTFVRRFKYRAHRMEHLPDEEKQFECTTCYKRFGSEAVLKYHQRLAHQPKKSAICEICGRNFIVEGK
jgi:transcription elongation factor Elf1